MKTRNHLTLYLLGALFLTGYGCSRQSEPAASSLEGRWTGYESGQPAAKCTATITGTNLVYRGARSNDWVRANFVVKDDVRPTQMDVTLQEGGVPEDAGLTLLAIYELQRDELKFAVGLHERPTNFAGGQGIRVFTFKRQ